MTIGNFNLGTLYSVFYKRVREEIRKSLGVCPLEKQRESNVFRGRYEFRAGQAFYDNSSLSRARNLSH